MKTTVVFEGKKVRIQGECKPKEAMEIAGLNPREWKVASRSKSHNSVMYSLARMSLYAVPAPAPQAIPAANNAAPAERPVDDSGPASTTFPRLKMVEPITGAVISGPDKPTSTDPAPSAGKTPETPSTPLTLTAPRKDLQEALKIALDFVAKKNLLPILSCVHLSSDAARLTIKVTDLECYWSHSIPITGDQASVCVPASLLYSEVKALDSDITHAVLTIGASRGTLSVNNRCDIVTTDAEEFPETPAVEGPTASISGLASVLKKVLPAASTDELRYPLTGIQVDPAKGKAVATDGYRLHHDDFPAIPADPATDQQPIKPFLLSRKAAQMIVKYGASAPSITMGESHVRVSLQSGTMTSRLLLGTFPDYENVLPADMPITVSFDHREFMKILEGAAPIAGQDRVVTLSINGLLSIETTGESGRYSYHIPCVSRGKGEEDYVLIYNMRFLIEAINAYQDSGPDVTVQLPSSYGATIINGKAIIMPIRR